MILLLGPSLNLACAALTIDRPLVALFAAPIVIACGAVDLFLRLAAACLNTLTLYAMYRESDDLRPAVGLVWCTAVLVWISSRGLCSVPDWAWTSQERAQASGATAHTPG